MRMRILTIGLLLTLWCAGTWRVSAAENGGAADGVDASIPDYAPVSGISGNLSSVGSDTMINLMREAIEVLHELPEERQETIARAILDFASHDGNVYHLTDEERREVRAGIAEIKRGEIASEEEVQAVYTRIGT